MPAPLFTRPSSPPDRRRRLAVGLLQILLRVMSILLLPPAVADCECGYAMMVARDDIDVDEYDSSSGGGGSSLAVFTDLIESDFTTTTIMASGDGDGGGDWVPQAFNLTPERARGVHGEMFDVGNVVFVGATADTGHDEEEEDGGDDGDDDNDDDDAGLRLMVRSTLVGGMVPGAEVDTRRLDLLWGTFRASMKVTAVPGTCAAFFWYFNDTQEIDMEFLSKDFNPANGSYPVNLVLQSRESALAGYDAARTGNFVRAHLPFDPTAGFHEYRIDYLPGRVAFYADGAQLADMAGPAVPSSPGHLILQHWSNGNERWSGGPPREDAALVVRYVKAYFNSSAPQRQRDWENRCRDPAAANAVCAIREGNWFFKDQGNMTNNQTVPGQSADSGVEMRWASDLAHTLLVILSAWLMLLGFGEAVALL